MEISPFGRNDRGFSAMTEGLIKKQANKKPRSCGVFYWYFLLSHISVTSIRMIGNITHTLKLGNLFHQGLLNALFQG